MIPLPDKKTASSTQIPRGGYQNRGTRAAANKHYDVMTVEDIKRMGVGAAGGVLLTTTVPSLCGPRSQC